MFLEPVLGKLKDFKKFEKVNSQANFVSENSSNA